MAESAGEMSPQVTQAKQELVDPRTISKKHDPQGRTATASAILETRRDERSIRKNIAQEETNLQQTQNQSDTLSQIENQKSAESAQRTAALSVRLKKLIGFGDKRGDVLEAELNAVRTEINVLGQQSNNISEKLGGLKERQIKIPSGKELLQAYYEKTLATPLTNREKRELLVPEVLANLSMEEYIALWRRLNPYFLSHVTRQGFRDHAGMMFHTSGLQEFQNGFIGILEDSKQLRPPLALRGLRQRDEVSVRKYLGWVLEAENKEEAKDRLNRLLNSSLASAPKYPDETAVHFAGQRVADHFYGGETGNDAFFLYPADVLASQHNFAFNWKTGNFIEPVPAGEGQWNDIFIWPNSMNNPGIPIDAGVVFLPESVPVDPQTGSKYASEVKIIAGQQKRVMVENTSLIHSFIEWGKQAITNKSELFKAAHKYYSGNFNDQDLAEGWIVGLGKEMRKMGFGSDVSLRIGRDLFLDLCSRPEVTEELLSELLPHILQKSGANWKRAENPVYAKDYWEGIFAKNPHLRPKHVVYYDGDPTSAVGEFQRKNNIGRADTSATEGSFLGFDDHKVVLVEKGSGVSKREQDPRSMLGYNELVATADKIISDHYRSPQNKAA